MSTASPDPSTPIPPPLPAAKMHGSLWIKLLLVLAALAAVLVLGGLTVAAARWALTKPGSTQNDEVHSTKKLTTDFGTWSAAMRSLERNGEFPGMIKAPAKKDDAAATKTTEVVTDDDARKAGLWDRWFVLPNESAVKAALLRRLPRDMKLLSLEPQSYEKNDEDLSVTYLVTVRPKSALYLVPVQAIKFNDPALAKYQALSQYLLASSDLAPGLSYTPESAWQVIEARKTFSFTWKVNRAAVEDGKWRVFDAEPIVFQQSPAFETKLVNTSNDSALLLRTQAEIDGMAAARDAALTAFAGRIKTIEEQVAKYRADRLAGVPGKVNRSSAKFGGSGSGEPTRSAARIGGGAAGGAAIGAMATGGDGEAAGIGAGAGLVAGLIYDMVSKSNDKKRFEAAKERDYQERLAARNAAVRSANNAVTAYQQQLINEYEKELTTAAQQRIDELKARDQG